MAILSEIGETIVYLRRQKGFTQERLALECGISISYLRLIEHGAANPTTHELCLIADGLEMEFQNPFADTAPIVLR